MAACTFFGHGNSPERIRAKLRETITALILDKNVDMFYVGNHGHFDSMVRSILRELQTAYPQIGYAVVLAYMPGKPAEGEDYSDTMLPEGIERVPKRFAISWRNNWMLERSDYVVAYVTHSWGGAAQFVEKAERHGCKVIDIGVDT